VKLVLKAHKELKAQEVHKVQRDRRVVLELKVKLVHKVLKV
jgi:hypothetical protein